MADSTVDALTAASALDGTEEYYAVQGGADRKVTGAQIKTLGSASPTLVTPNLGTPTAGVLTSCTGLLATGGGTGQSTYTKGDLLASPGSNTLNKLAVGADATVLTADAASTNGVKWAAAAGGGSMSIGGTVTSGTTGSILFVGAGPVLAQDNTKLFWDDTNDILKINGGNAVFMVANGSGNNWFEGDAGNLTLTGYQNFGTGTNTLAGLTTGHQNTAIGSDACKSVTTGNLNVAFGTLSLENCTSGSNNMAIGGSVLRQLITGTGNTGIGANSLTSTTGDSNTAVGLNAGKSVTSGSNNVAVGDNALGGATLGDLGNVAIGHNTTFNLASGNFNVGIGWGASGTLVTGSSNVCIGVNAGQVFEPGSTNTFVGPFCAKNVTSGDNNTVVGGWVGPSGAMSSVVALSDGAGTLLFDYGNTNAATWTSPKAICVTPVAVASLPTAGIQGRRHFVTNATATTFASIVAGGGGNPVPVYDDGTNWRIG